MEVFEFLWCAYFDMGFFEEPAECEKIESVVSEHSDCQDYIIGYSVDLAGLNEGFDEFAEYPYRH